MPRCLLRYSTEYVQHERRARYSCVSWVHCLGRATKNMSAHLQYLRTRYRPAQDRRGPQSEDVAVGGCHCHCRCRCRCIHYTSMCVPPAVFFFLFLLPAPSSTRYTSVSPRCFPLALHTDAILVAGPLPL